MSKQLKAIMQHPLISGSSIVFIGSFGANILGYLFNLFMGRLLPVSEYGLLTALTSLMVLFGIFQTSLVGIFAKFAATYKAREDSEGIQMLMTSGMRFVIVFALIVFVLLTLATPFLSQFMKVESPVLLILVFTSILIAIIFAFPMGMLQGGMQFKTISILNILGPLIKLLLAVVLIIVGSGIFGVLIGLLIASIVTLLMGMLVIRRRHRKSGPKTDIKGSVFLQEFKSYSLYFFLATLGMTIISNIDIILVRNFFDPVVSGQYAALSLMGKAIFYLTSPIYFVFFPLIAQKKERNEKILKTLLLTIGIITSISVALSFGYFLFPQLVLTIFFPAQEYAVLAQYLGPFSLFILVFSLANLFNNYFLSIGKTGIYKINLAVALLFVIAVSLFHESLYQVIGVLFATSFLLLISYLLYYYQVNNG